MTGGGAFVARLTNAATGKSGQGKAKDNGDGTYTAVYKAPVLGAFTLAVTMAGDHVMGSPFDLLEEHSERLLPRTAVGRILELLIGRDYIRSNHVFLNAEFSILIQSIALQKIPKFTDGLSELSSVCWK